MSQTETKLAEGYDKTYSSFNSALSKKIRAEAYDNDFGQHSWITYKELCDYIQWLGLSENDHLLDLGCGPGGPLTQIVTHSNCEAIGIDLNSAALAVAEQNADGLNLSDLIRFRQHDLNHPLPFKNSLFDAAISIDVILHLQNREKVFREIYRVLKPNSKFLFTDAGILTGPISNDEITIRSINGYTQFVHKETNEQFLSSAGFRLERCVDVTEGVIKNASGRYSTRIKYQDELMKSEGQENFNKEQIYLKTTIDLYKRKSLARYTYFAIRD
jgi:ubiquinone/menaquinone biosynthesis C-methylase UbiE